MPREDAALKGYRRFLAAFCIVAGLIVAVVGGVLLWRGTTFPAFLALLVIRYLVLLARGYQQDEREREQGGS